MSPNLSLNKVNHLVKQIKMGIFDKSKTVECLESCVNKKEDDWDLIMSACDAVNTSENGAKEAAKFIRKKMTKSINVQLRTLTVLQTMADNCGAKFHAEIASKKFLDDIELVATSPNTDVVIKQRIVSLLGTLTEMFQNEPSLYQISNLYSKLTGNRVPTQQRSVQYPIQNNSISNDVSEKARITEDIEISKNNIQLLTQTLAFTDPEKEDITRNDLIQEFYTRCKSLHQNIMTYLSQVQDENWMNTLLAINQDFVNAFKMYEDMVERGQVIIAKYESEKQSTRPYLIDFDSEGAGVGSSSSYDPFADSNEVDYDPVVSGPSAKALGKMPASKFYDSKQNYNTSNNSSSLYNEYPNKTSTSPISPTIRTQKVQSSLFNDPTLFEEEESASENQQQQYSNIAAPLEPRSPQEHIVI